MARPVGSGDGSGCDPYRLLAVAVLWLALSDAKRGKPGARLWFEICPQQVEFWSDAAGLGDATIWERVREIPAFRGETERKSRKRTGGVSFTAKLRFV